MLEDKQTIDQFAIQDTEAETEEFTWLEKSLLNNFQRNFPLSPRPFDEIARELNVDTKTVIATLRKLESEKKFSRIGPVFRPNSFNSSLLAAMHVPENDIEMIARIINSYKEVNHNYEREHYFNLWFVVHGPNEDHIHTVLDEIEWKTGLSTLRLPILNDFHIDLGFDLQWN